MQNTFRWFCLAMGLASFGTAAVAATAPTPGELVIFLDPETDFVATKPEWVQTRGAKFLGCEVVPKKANKAALVSPPFTLTEIRTAAAKSKRLTQRTVNAKVVEGVTIAPQPHAGVPGFLALGEYVAQVNAIEKFLNLYGRSLRERVSALGTVAKLRPKSPKCTPKMPQYIPIPDPRKVKVNPGDPAQIRINPGDLYVFNLLGKRGTLMRPHYQLHQPSDPQSAAFYRSIDEWGAGGRWLAPAAATLARDYAGGLDTLGVASSSHRYLLGDAKTWRGYQNLGSMLGFKIGVNGPLVKVLSADGCPDPAGAPADTGTGTKLGNPRLCPICHGSDCPAPTSDACNVGAPGASQGSNQSGGEWQLTTGEPGKNLCDGTFALNMAVWSGCITSGMNDWFAGQSCVAITSANKGHDGAFYFDDSVSLQSGMLFFGESLNLITASADATFDTSAGGPKTHGPTISGWIADAGSNGVYKNTIDGPSTVIPVFGYPLVITSNLQVDLDGQGLKPTANPLPGDCTTAGPAPVVAVTGNAHTKVSANLHADFSIVIVQAQLNATLDLLNDSIMGSIDTTADRGANLVSVQPKVTYVQDKGGGNVTAAFTIDLLFTSKTWSIDIVSWNGFHKPGEFAAAAGTVKAVHAPKLVCSGGSSS